jgi:hypothetical protein
MIWDVVVAFKGFLMANCRKSTNRWTKCYLFDIFKQKSCVLKQKLFFKNVSPPCFLRYNNDSRLKLTGQNLGRSPMLVFDKILRFGFRITKKHNFDHIYVNYSFYSCERFHLFL